MVHTYGERRVREQSAAARLVATLGPVILLAALGWAAMTLVGRGAGWGNLAFVAAFGFWIVCVSAFGHRRGCREIRLSDDGTCELMTGRRVIRLHVNQISAVEYYKDDESDYEQYTVKYNGGSVVASESIDDFEDFLNRLKTLNPGLT
jgi:hypothetical protein